MQSFAKIIAENVTKNLTHCSSKKPSGLPKLASNLPELLQLEKDVEMIVNRENYTIQCKICDEFLKSLFGKQPANTDQASGSISKGLTLKEGIELYESGHNKTWYRMKNRILSHLNSDESKMQLEARKWWKCEGQELRR